MESVWRVGVLREWCVAASRARSHGSGRWCLAALLVVAVSAAGCSATVGGTATAGIESDGPIAQWSDHRAGAPG